MAEFVLYCIVRFTMVAGLGVASGTFLRLASCKRIAIGRIFLALCCTFHYGLGFRSCQWQVFGLVSCNRIASGRVCVVFYVHFMMG